MPDRAVIRGTPIVVRDESALFHGYGDARMARAKKNDGSDLEILVRKIEQSIAGSEYSVEARKRIYQDGVLIGEFDLIISGKVGSISVRYLFEMRDRPSKGPQGREWIQQLIGRRTAEKFDGVAAVSTTGFAKPAQNLAKEQNIALRTVRSATDLAEGIKLVSFRVTNPQIIPSGRFKLVPLNTRDIEWLASNPVFHTKRIFFRELDSFVEKPFFNFVLDNLPRDFDQDAEGARLVRLNILRPIEVRVQDRSIITKEIDAVIQFKKGDIKGNAIAMRDYVDGSELLGQHVSVLFEAPMGTIRTDFAVAFKDDTAEMQLLDVDWPGEANR